MDLRAMAAMVAVAIIVLVAWAYTGLKPASPANPAAFGSNFTYEGQLYSLADGNVYKILPQGGTEFVMKMYDPGFYAKNYVEINGSIMQRQQGTGKLFQVARRFSDGFEDASDVDGLIGVGRWHTYDADPSKAGQAFNYYDNGSRIGIVHDGAHSGQNALRFFAAGTAGVTKAEIDRELLFYRKGDKVFFSFWAMLEKTPGNATLTLWDLESDWLEQSQGIRLIFRDGALAYELKSFRKIGFGQATPVPFPAGRWVRVQGSILLSDGQDGHVVLWQEGRQVLDASGSTLPVAEAVYDVLGVGITSLSGSGGANQTLLVDDVVISDNRSEAFN